MRIKIPAYKVTGTVANAKLRNLNGQEVFLRT